MSNAKEMPNYRSVAFKLINTCRDYVETSNIIELIGYYLALHKQGKLNDLLFYGDELEVITYYLDLGLSRPIFLNDICKKYSLKKLRFLVQEILNIDPLGDSLASIYAILR